MKRIVISLVALFALALLIAACDDNGEDEAEIDTQDDPTDQPDAADPNGDDDDATEDDSADEDDSELRDFVYASVILPATVDPIEPGAIPDYLGVERASRPVSYDPSQLADRGCSELPTSADIRGELAESWEFSDDRKTITMKFREGVLSPFGNEMTSEDVKWSLDRSINISTSVRFFLSTMALWASIHHPSGEYDESPITIVDDYTIEIAIADPGSLDVTIMASPRWQIFDYTEVQNHITDDDPWAEEWLQQNSANFGPWHHTADDFESGEELVMVRNPNYYAADEMGNIDRLIMRTIPEGSTRAQLVVTGEVDHANKLSPTDYAQVADAATGQVLDCVAADRTTFILNHADEKYSDVRVRKAISLALDRQEIADGAYHGFALPSTDGLNQGYDFDPPDDEDLRLHQDVEEARRLLEEAGYPDGFDTTIHLSLSEPGPGPPAEQIAVLIQAQLSDIGVNAQLEIVASGTEFSTQFLEGQYEAIVYQEPPALPDPAYAAGLYSHSQSHQNSFGYSDETYDEMQSRILHAAADDPQRREYIREMSEYIVEQVPKIYLVDTGLPRAFSDAVDTSNYEHHPYQSQVFVHKLSKN